MVQPESYAVLQITLLISAALAPLGLYLLLRRRAQPAGRWVPLAVLLFVCARVLHSPAVRNEGGMKLPGSELVVYNLDYLGTMTCTTVALVYCAAAIAWTVGRDVHAAVPHVAAVGTAAILIASFLASDLRDRYVDYLPDAFDGSLVQSIYWAVTAAVILSVSAISAILTLRIIPAVKGPVRIMMVLMCAASALAFIFSVHILVRVFVNHLAPTLLPGWYLTHSREIAMYLILVLVPLLLAAVLCPIGTRLVHRIHRFITLYQHRFDWLESRSSEHRHRFEDLPVPQSARECWVAAATPTAAYRCLLEINIAASVMDDSAPQTAR